MTKFIAIMSGKGGVGKTTTSINLSYAAAKKGADVILVEGNLSAPNLSLHLGNSIFPITLHDVLASKKSIHDAIHKHDSGVKLIPADTSIEAMKFVDFEKLSYHLQDLNFKTDYVFIDGSPGLGRESVQLIALADELIIVTHADMVSVRDAMRVISMAEKLNKLIAGIVVSHYQNKSHELSISRIENLTNQRVIAVIPHCNKFQESILKKQPYAHVYPKKESSKKYYELASLITGRVL